MKFPNSKDDGQKVWEQKGVEYLRTHHFKKYILERRTKEWAKSRKRKASKLKQYLRYPPNLKINLNLEKISMQNQKSRNDEASNLKKHS